MVKSTAKQKSIERIFREYQDIPLEDITRIQANYVNKNPRAIKQILNKNGIADKTAMGYGRWANQYITHLSEVRQKEVNVAKKVNVNLTKSFSENLKVMGNSVNYRISKTTKKEVLKNHQLIRMNSKYFSELGNAHELFLRNNEKVFKKYRIKLEVLTDNGRGYVQTFGLSLHDYSKFSYLVKKMKDCISRGIRYEFHDKNIKKTFVNAINRIILEVER